MTTITDDQGRPRNLVYLGTFSEGVPNIAVLPHELMARAAAQLDVEKARRERDEALARLAVMQAARAQGKLRKALHALGFRGRRIR